MAKIKHGDTGTPLFNRWNSMINRCKQGRFSDTYYNKGIKICKEWQDYESFKYWALNNGWNQSLELDRIENDKGYSPDNCRFVPKIVNNSNRSNTVFINYKGKCQSLTLYCLENNIPDRVYKAIRRRIKNGWDHVKAIETPIKPMSFDHGRRIIIRDFRSGITYTTVKDAAKSVGMHASHLSDALNGKRRNKTTLIKVQDQQN